MARPLLGVAGFPVAHSRSPAMFAPALREAGLDWLYVRLPLPPERFSEAAVALPSSGFRGINVTMPHKHAAHALADDLTPAAAAIGAANTLTYVDGRIEADNTDASGLVDALDWEDGAPAGTRCLVLGAGGSARAAAWALREAGAAEVSVWNRTAGRAAELAADLGIRHAQRVEAADLVVNCTAVGMGGGLAPDAAADALGLRATAAPATFCDFVYDPAGPTPLGRWAEAAGARVVDGLEVLVSQGARSFERWTGRTAPVAAMRAGARGSAAGTRG